LKTRREFLKDSATVVAFSAIAGKVGAATTQSFSPALATSTPYRVIYDNRFEQSSMFAQQAQRLGLQTSVVDGDVSHLWRKVLQPQLRKNPVPLVGLTMTSTLFCLSELAKNHWMKVQFFAEHESLADGVIKHNLSGPENILRQANRLADATCNWPESMADIIAYCPQQLERVVTTSITVPTDRSGLIKEQLVSWIIMPTNANRKA
jgi:hypothetical protein